MVKQIAEYEILIIDWAEQRGILEHSTPMAQLLKSASEMGEMMDNIVKGNDIKDDVGDFLVTLVLQGRLYMGPDFTLGQTVTDPYKEGSFVNVEDFEFNTGKDLIAMGGGNINSKIGAGAALIYRMGMLADAVGREDGVGVMSYIGDLVYSLIALAVFHDLTLAQCLDHAWAEIKDRRGHMSAGGVFVKDEPAKAVIAQCEVQGAIGIGKTCEYWNNTREICALGVEHSCRHLVVEDAE